MFPLTCNRCSKHFESRASNARFCSSQCASYRYHPTIRDPDHPLANRAGHILPHRKVLYEKIGPGEHPCNWCGKALRWMAGIRSSPEAIEADHLDYDGLNNDPANLVPACHMCNCRRGHTQAGYRHWNSISDSAQFIVREDGYRRRTASYVCAQCGREFTAVLRKKPQIYCSLSCSAKRGASLRHGRPIGSVVDVSGST